MHSDLHTLDTGTETETSPAAGVQRREAAVIFSSVPEVGERFSGRVVGFLDASALVLLRKHVVALLPYYEYSWVDERIDLKDRLKPGATIDVVVTKIAQKDDGRAYIKVSHRQTQRNPWETIDAEHPVGSKTWAQVEAITPATTWVVLESGYRARIAQRELAWWPLPESAGEAVQVGQWIEVVVLTLDKENRRIEASYRQAQDYPWETIEREHPTGSKTRAQVQSFHNAGTRITLETGHRGWIDCGELAWSPGRVRGDEVLEIGQWIDVVVQRTDREHRSVCVSYRDTIENPWKTVSSRFSIGSETCGVVERVERFGAFVRLDSDFVGLMHKSNMHTPDALPSPGETVRVRILQIDKIEMRIRLGQAAETVEKDESAKQAA